MCCGMSDVFWFVFVLSGWASTGWVWYQEEEEEEQPTTNRSTETADFNKVGCSFIDETPGDLSLLSGSALKSHRSSGHQGETVSQNRWYLVPFKYVVFFC